ncbi:MAG: hypothetical protein R2716_08820 [Microthrixaceae bacterium]
MKSVDYLRQCPLVAGGDRPARPHRLGEFVERFPTDEELVEAYDVSRHTAGGREGSAPTGSWFGSRAVGPPCEWPGRTTAGCPLLAVRGGRGRWRGQTSRSSPSPEATNRMRRPPSAADDQPRH